MSADMEARVLRGRAQRYRRIAALPASRLSDWRRTEVLHKTGYEYGAVQPNLVGNDLRAWLLDKAGDLEVRAHKVERAARPRTNPAHICLADASTCTDCCFGMCDHPIHDAMPDEG